MSTLAASCCPAAVCASWLQLEDIGARVFFEKQLTSSDVSASGRVVVPKVSVQQCPALAFGILCCCSDL